MIEKPWAVRLNMPPTRKVQPVTVFPCENIHTTESTYSKTTAFHPSVLFLERWY
jgi:hypothetical protein